MPKIRKKTSARQSTRMKESIKKKVSASKSKAKKAAKKDITWKSKNKKDPGIPSLFPFKDEILQEVQNARNQKEANRLAKKGKTVAQDLAQSIANTTQEIDLDDAVVDQESSAFEDDAANLKTYARSLRSVISSSDLLIQVLDGRDPQGSRTLSLEKEILANTTEHTAKKLVFVLNKIDLVPKDNVEAWLKYYRRSFPTLAFKSSTQSQRNHLATNDSGVQALLTLLKSYARGSAKSMTVGVIGLPNVGKSSLINTLKRSKACSVAPTPGWTKDIQQISLDGGLKILDCPGVVLDDPSSEEQDPSLSLAQKVLRNAVNIDKLDDTLTPVEVILSKSKKEHLMMFYNIPNFNTIQEFLIHVARARGRIRKGGLPDLQGSAKSVIRDWCAGRIRYYTVPPALDHASSTSPVKNSSMADVGAQDKIVAVFAPEFDLDALFKEADDEVLGSLQDAKSLQSVALIDSLAKAGSDQARPKLLGEEDETMNEDSGSATPTAKSALRSNEPETVSVAPKKKVVSFAASQTSRIFDADEAPVSENKAIKLAAKKDRKRKAKAAANDSAMDTSETAAESANAGPTDAGLGLEVRTGALSFADTADAVDEPYDWTSFFGISGPKKAKLDV